MSGVDPGELTGRHLQRADHSGHVVALPELIDHHTSNLVVVGSEAAAFTPHIAIRGDRGDRLEHGRHAVTDGVDNDELEEVTVDGEVEGIASP
jgi:hypothetical protein